MRNPWKIWRSVMWGVALVSALVLGLFLSWRDHKGGQSGSQTDPVVFQDFTLQDPLGKAFRLHHQKKPFLLLYFGYTYCPDICPLALHNMTHAWRALTPQEQEQIQLVFVTVDPQRDTPEALASYATLFTVPVVFLTGTPDQIEPVLKAYGVFAQKAEPEGSASDYLIDHSSMIYGMKRNGTLFWRLGHTTSPQVLVDAIRSSMMRESS